MIVVDTIMQVQYSGWNELRMGYDDTEGDL